MTDRNEAARIATGKAWAWADAALLLHGMNKHPQGLGIGERASADAYAAELVEIKAYLDEKARRWKTSARLERAIIHLDELARKAGMLVCANCGTCYEKKANGDWNNCPYCGDEYFYDN